MKPTCIDRDMTLWEFVKGFVCLGGLVFVIVIVMPLLLEAFFGIPELGRG